MPGSAFLFEPQNSESANPHSTMECWYPVKGENLRRTVEYSRSKTGKPDAKTCMSVIKVDPYKQTDSPTQNVTKSSASKSRSDVLNPSVSFKLVPVVVEFSEIIFYKFVGEEVQRPFSMSPLQPQWIEGAVLTKEPHVISKVSFCDDSYFSLP